MHAKILIVDAIATNRIVLKVKLAGAFYDVSQAGSIKEAVCAAASVSPDLIICGCNLPDGDAATLASHLRTKDGGSGVPIMTVAPGLDSAARQVLLAEGIDDVVENVYHDSLLLARVRSLIRAHTSATEWHIRDDTTRALGVTQDRTLPEVHPKIMIVGSDLAQAQVAACKLRPEMAARVISSLPTAALNLPAKGDVPALLPDIYVLLAEPENEQSILSLISSIRCNADTRHCAILVVHDDDAPMLGAQALDLGANALMVRDEGNTREMSLRLAHLMRRKRIADQLRATLHTGLKAAVSDPLTGLHNRRYAMPHLARLTERAANSGRPFALMVADLDHFKQVNDIYGHAAGDAVLVETANRLRENLRAVDLIARIGGEEFLIVMPGVDLPDARLAAKRLCDLIGDEPFKIPGTPTLIDVTISIGLALGGLPQDVPLHSTSHEEQAQALIARADKALYAAKIKGRNCVKLGRPAA